jgi:uncharacterized DUF497 family protein
LQFEYDENKSNLNKIKHGIDFEEAKSIFNEKNVFIKRAKTIDDEERYAITGLINKKCYTIIFTFREANIRLISARRCRKNEKKRIESD